MSNKDELEFTFAKRKASPLVQFAVSLVLSLLVMLAGKGLKATADFSYVAAFVGILFFSIINTLVSVANASYFRYTVPSYALYVALVIITFLCAKFFSNISIWSLSEYRLMLISVTMFYVTASLLVRVIRLIYELSENDK